MAQIGTTLSYWMPETEFTVAATKRMTVNTLAAGSHLAPVVDIELSHAAVADRTNRRCLTIDAGLLEKIALTLSLDDRGFLTAVNSEAGRDIAPVVSLLGKVISLAATLALLGRATHSGVTDEAKSLEQQWADTHKGLACHLEALLAQVDRLLGVLSAPLATPDAIVSTGRALDAVYSQVASISEARRNWIVAKACVVAEANVPLRTFELLHLQVAELPDQLGAPVVPVAQTWLTEEFGCLLAVIDAHRPEGPAAIDDGQTAETDVLCLRHSRPVTLGIYLKGAHGWELDAESVQHLDVVDRFSADDVISLDGRWLQNSSFELAYHPDMSVKTFGVRSTSSVSTAAISLGSVFDAAAAAREKAAKRPSAAAQELAEAKAKLDLLKTASEFEVLSATRERAAAVALAEQLAKLKC